MAPPHPSIAADLAAWGRRNPVGWIKKCLGVDLWGAQREVAWSVRDNIETDVASCHALGKSRVAASILLWYLCCHDRSAVITTAPSDRQVRLILWREVRTLHARALVPLPGAPLQQKLELESDWLAWGFASPDYDEDKFQGVHSESGHILVIVDEACGIAPAIMGGVDALLTSDKARVLRIGNPTNPRSEFKKTWAANKNRLRFSAFDTPNFTEFGITDDDMRAGLTEEIGAESWRKKITRALPRPYLVTPEWAQMMYRKYGADNAYCVARVRGEFPQSSEDSLIDIAWIEEAKLRNITPHKTDIVRLGLDVAFEGDDETACYENHGGRIRRAFSYRGHNTMQTVGRVVEVADERKAATIGVDSVGMGSGLLSRLEELDQERASKGARQLNPLSVKFGNTAPNEDRFANLKSELYWRVRELFESGQADIDPEDEDLAMQAAAIRKTLDSKGRIAIQPKKILKKPPPTGIGVSPDRFEAVAYSMATEEDIGGQLFVA